MSDAKDRIGCVALGRRWQTAGGVRTIARIVDGDVHYAEGGFDRRATLLNDPEYTPIAAPEPAKPQHPERRAGQTWRWDGNGKDYLLSRPEVMGTEKVWWCAARGENEGFFREPVFERGELTLIADAPAPEATGKADMFGCPYCPMTFANVQQRDAHAHPSRGPHLCANPLPAGKVEAAKAMPKCDRGCSASAAVRFVKNFGTGYVERRRLCDMCYLRTEPDRAIPSTSVLRADTPQLIDRRRRYQPIDDSFAEDA